MSTVTDNVEHMKSEKYKGQGIKDNKLSWQVICINEVKFMVSKYRMVYLNCICEIVSICCIKQLELLIPLIFKLETSQKVKYIKLEKQGDKYYTVYLMCGELTILNLRIM